MRGSKAHHSTVLLLNSEILSLRHGAFSMDTCSQKGRVVLVKNAGEVLIPQGKKAKQLHSAFFLFYARNISHLLYIL